MPQKKNKTPQPAVDPRAITPYALADLLLDEDNPRFGMQDRGSSQEALLDLIVEKFGVDDVLSSLAVNGYFTAEPMVCRQLEGANKAVVVEGNRRLAACLIITADKRAANQAKRTAEYRVVWEAHGCPPIDPVPTIMFGPHEQEDAILSYLGVRHIASSQAWDSYAKAAWIARVVEQNKLTVADVSSMIGDQHSTVARLLEGYYLVRQLQNEGMFQPEDSVRGGRGSVTDYPFSWVYTALNYRSIREFLRLGDRQAAANPLDRATLPKGRLLLEAMFGNKSKGRNASLSDSRQIGLLANAVASPEKVHLLEQGKTVEEIETLTLPLEETLSQGLGQARDLLKELVTRLAASDLDKMQATTFLPLANQVRRLAADLEKRLKENAEGSDGAA